jgi:tetratricopeptide (TPR) repeat protein
MTKRHKKRRTQQLSVQAHKPRASRKVFWTILLLVLVLGVGGMVVVLSRRESSARLVSRTPPAPIRKIPANDPPASLFGPADTVAQIEAEELRLARVVEAEFPETAEACFLLGSVYGEQGDTDKQTLLWRKALTLDPRRADIHAKLAQHARDQGDMEQALIHWQQSLALNPRDEGACWGMANIHLERNEPESAVEFLERACGISPETIRNHYLLGQAHLELKAYEKARAQFEKTIALDPEHFSAYYGLARVLRFLQQPEQAKDCLVKFRELKQTYDGSLTEEDTLDDLSYYRTRIARYYVQVYDIYKDRGQADNGFPYLERALQLDSGSTHSLERMGVYFSSNRQYARARAVYQKALQLHPQKPMYAVNIGKTYALENQNSQAEKIFQKIIEQHPNYVLGYVELARLYLRTQWNLSATIRLAQQAVALEPSAANYYYLCWAYDANGQYAEALEAIERALARAPRNERYQQLHERIKRKL